MENALSQKHIKTLKAMGHHLSPVLWVGNKGISESLIKQTQNDLDAHELIKIKVQGENRDMRSSIAAKIAEATGSQIIQNLGHTYLVYKEGKVHNRKIKLK